jgi:hypothetical protein
MQKRLNPQKVVKAIDILLVDLEKALKTKSDFVDLHKKTLQLCENIFDAKKSYKEIDVSYPVSIVIVITDFSGKKTKKDKRMHIPDKKLLRAQKEELLKKDILVLREVSEIYELRSSLI